MPDYKNSLNTAQYNAATSKNGHTLVIAGAGSGKTRTIVYRLAWLAEQGVSPEEILLLTFTRKAAQEMLSRAEALLGRGLRALPGGTFHSFAFNTLRFYRPEWLQGRPFTLMDSADINQLIKECREKSGSKKRDSAFPKTPAIASLLGRARNRELALSTLIHQENPHLAIYADELEEIGEQYSSLKQERALLDYDDLLFELENLFKTNAHAAFALRNRFRHILVDEYQDTNLVQARIVRQLAMPPQEGLPGASVMAVGDEAQSIYAFRGANMRNIMEFPKLFPGTNIIRLEQNYRSTQPILDIANEILTHAKDTYNKRLFTTKTGGALPILARPISDLSEATMVGERIRELLKTHKPHEIAVLFRAGFHSYPLENVLHKKGIPFRKYGGLRFVEAAHIKDIISFARLALNPLDELAFRRIALMHKGIGPKTLTRLRQALLKNDSQTTAKAFKRFPEFLADLEFVENLKGKTSHPEQFIEALSLYYQPRLEALYPDDWPIRQQGVLEIQRMAQLYDDMEVFIADLALDPVDQEPEANAEDTITLSTIHSAKGLEWNAVIILDVVEERFPSRHSSVKEEDFEEERRLFYVACTRARQTLDIFAPRAIYSNNGGCATSQSPFLQELSPTLFENISERPAYAQVPPPIEPASETCSGLLAKGGKALTNAVYCRHKLFGRGKILKKLDDDRIQVNFPGFGIKVILADYLMAEE